MGDINNVQGQVVHLLLVCRKIQVYLSERNAIQDEVQEKANHRRTLTKGLRQRTADTVATDRARLLTLLWPNLAQYRQPWRETQGRA